MPHRHLTALSTCSFPKIVMNFVESFLPQTGILASQFTPPYGAGPCTARRHNSRQRRQVKRRRKALDPAAQPAAGLTLSETSRKSA
jgi:hypothetical protein